MPDIEIKNIVKLFAVLLLSEKDLSGYEIMREVEKKSGKKASPGQIYPFLKQLKSYRYVDTEGRGARDRQIYHLTPEGYKFVARLSSKFDSFLEIAIKPKLTICAHCGCEIYKGGYREKISGRYLDFCCKNCAESYKMTNKQ